MPLSNEEKALKKILDAVSDIRVDVGYLGFYLNQAEGPDKNRLIQVLQAAGLYSPEENGVSDENGVNQESDTDDETTETIENSEEHSLTEKSDVEATESETWIAKIPKVINHSGSLEDFTEVILGILNSGVIYQHPNGEAEALGRRVIWNFENGSLLWTGPDENIFFSHISEEYGQGDSPALPSSVLPDEFSFNADTNGWEMNKDLTLTLIQQFEQIHGKAKIILPWGGPMEYMVENGFEEFCNQIGIDEDDEDYAKYSAAFEFLSGLIQNEISVPGNVWDLELDYGDGYMPLYSKAGRFNQFLGSLSDNGWEIIYDECCGSCASGTLRALAESEESAGKPVFITWEQNADSTWGIPGWINHMHLAGTEDEVEYLLNEAPKFGLEVTKDKEDKRIPGSLPFLYFS